MYINGSGRDYYEFYIQLNRCGTLGKNAISEKSRENPTVSRIICLILILLAQGGARVQRLCSDARVCRSNSFIISFYILNFHNTHTYTRAHVRIPTLNQLAFALETACEIVYNTVSPCGVKNILRTERCVCVHLYKR